MKKMTKKQMYLYGLPGLATLFTFTMFTTYGLYFFTDVVGLSGSFAGFIMTIGTVWDAITDPLVGMISDARDPQKGRRRPFLIAFAIPFGIVTWLLFTSWNFVETTQKIYFIVVAILFYTFQTLIDIPYTSLSGEVTNDYDTRSRLATIRTFWAIVGVALGSGIMAYTSFLAPFVGSIKNAWSICFAIFGFICTISILIGWKVSKGYENQEDIIKEKVTFKDLLNGPLRNKAFLHLTAAFIFAILAQAVFLGVLVYYLTYNLQLNNMQVSMVNIIMWIVALFWVFPINKWSIKYSKAKAWCISMGICFVCMIVFPLFILKPKSAIGPVIMTSILVVGLNALYQVIYAMISDCVEVDCLVNKVRKDGIFYSMATVSQKIAAAIGVSILGNCMDKIGYNGQLATQSLATQHGIALLFIGVTCMCLLLSIICMMTNPLTKKRYQDVLEALKKKEQGQKINIEEFKDLLIIKMKR